MFPYEFSFSVAQAGVEPARPLRTKGFSHHYSFHYQNSTPMSSQILFPSEKKLRALVIRVRQRLPLNCLWSGLALNHIEILQESY